MKTKTHRLATALAGISILALCAISKAEVSIIPQPLVVQEPAAAQGTAAVTLDSATTLYCDESALEQLAREGIAARTGLSLGGRGEEGTAIRIDTKATSPEVTALGREGYTLEVAAGGRGKQVKISASSPAGGFYGLQTLLQLLKKNEAGQWTVPVVKIADKPRFGWRGILVDDARSFNGKENIKRLLDIMAHFKLNTMQWHLTDNEGWRIEIKKYPRLTRDENSWRNPTYGKRPADSPHGGFYTQDEIREIVAYAAARNITIVPEVEMPAHAGAAIRAYPELGVKDVPNALRNAMRTRHSIFGPNEETFRFIDDVFTEIFALFPSKIIHIGGDEAPKDFWKKSPHAQKIIRENNLKNEDELQSWFLRRVEKIVNAKGRSIIGWDEIQEGGLSPTATMMVWRDVKWATHALNNGNNIVLTPLSHCYFDYPQGEYPNHPFYRPFSYRGCPTTVLEHAYSFEPIPAGTSPEREKQVLGCQGNLWGEMIYAWPKLEYQLFPRALALSEVAWSAKEHRNWGNFQKRLPDALAWLDGLKVNYRKADGTPANPPAGIVPAPK